jgi:hypothetical protein
VITSSQGLIIKHPCYEIIMAEALGGNARSFLPAVPTARASYIRRSDASILLRDFGRRS